MNFIDFSVLYTFILLFNVEILVISQETAAKQAQTDADSFEFEVSASISMNMLSCGNETKENVTHFANVGYPSAYYGSGTCELSVKKSTPDVVQLKLVFETFSVAKPDSDGACMTDKFVVSGASAPVPVICGDNSGNHMYVEFGDGPVMLIFTSSGTAVARQWKIHIEQISRGAMEQAPQGCLQYFRGTSGVIKSYNFGSTSGQQLANQDYSACIEPAKRFCGVRYTVCDDADGSRAFSVTGYHAPGAAMSVGHVGSPNCMRDWVGIPCVTNSSKPSKDDMTMCQDRLCGGIFNSGRDNSWKHAPVYSYERPFKLMYHTDSNEMNDLGNRGFCLNYMLEPCTM